MGPPGMKQNDQSSNMNIGKTGQQQRVMVPHKNFLITYGKSAVSPKQGQMHSQPLQLGTKQFATGLTQATSQNRVRPDMPSTQHRSPRTSMPVAGCNTVRMNQQPLNQLSHSQRSMHTGGMIPSSAGTSQIQSIATRISSPSSVYMPSRGQTSQTLSPAASPQVTPSGSHNQHLMVLSPAMLTFGTAGTGLSPEQVDVHQGQHHSNHAHMHLMDTPRSAYSQPCGSVPETRPPHSSSIQSGPQLTELNIARKEIRSEGYLEELIRVRKRFILDEKQVPQFFDNCIEILEYRRNDVTAVQLHRDLEASIKLLDQNTLGFSLLKELRMCPYNDLVNLGMPDPWEGAREQFIRVPDEVISVINPVRSHNTNRKRKYDDHTSDVKK